MRAELRWAGAVRREGWPPAVMAPSASPAIVAPHGHGSAYILSRMVAAAPPEVKVGETVIAVVVARFADDRCDRNLRAVRVYRAPGATDRTVSAGAIPEGLVPILE